MELSYRSREVNIGDYFRVLYRRRWVAILTFSVIIVSVAIHTLLATPQFEAAGLIEIQDEKSQSPVLNEILQLGQKNQVQAEMEVIKSRTLAELVVRELSLDQFIFEQNPVSLKPRLDDVVIHNRLKGRVYTVEFTEEPGELEISSERDGGLGEGNIGEPFEAEDLSFTVNCDSCRPGNSFKFVIHPFRQAVAAVQEATSVQKVGDNTGLIQITYRSQYPELARNIVNTVIELYQRENKAERAAEASQALKFINGQLEVIKQSLAQSEKELNNFKQEHGVMILDAEAGGLIDNLADFEVQKSKMELEFFQYQNLLAMVNSGSGIVNMPNFSKENTVLANLVLELVQMQAQKKNLLADFTEKHPEVLALQSKIDNVKASIKDIVAASIKQAKGQIKSFEEVIDQYNEKLKALPEKERLLAGLKRNATVSAEIYTFLLQKLEEARIAEASTLSSIRVIDKAVVPLIPISPNVRLNLLLGLLAGLLMAVGVAFTLEFIDDSLKTVEEVERHVNRPLYGIIPRIPDTGSMVEKSRSTAANLVTHYSPKSPISEAFRTLRTNINFADPDRNIRTLLVSSAGPSEGKSTIVSNLAITLANSGRKTLLMDCDLRKPNIHNIFELPRDPGLTTVLSGEGKWQDLIHKTKIDGLSVLTSGPIPPNPTEMVDSAAMRNQVEEFKREFDIVLLDSPPIVAVTDAAVISSYLNAVLLVVELGRSRATGVNRAIDLLEKVNANLLGLVTNNISTGYKYDYGYYYYYYYSADGDKKQGKRHRKRYGY